MTEALGHAVADAIGAATGRRSPLSAHRPVSGGCINDARIVDLADGRRFFVKSNPDPLPGLFEREAEGLAALADGEALRVPAVIALGSEPQPFLVLEAIDPAPRRPGFDAELGRGLAALHRTTADRFGFAHDNYLGSTPQPNPWTDDWPAFWRDHRLGHLMGLLRAQGAADRELNQLADRLLEQLDDILAEPDESASLLHGDLWSGNVMAGPEGGPVILDPAVYWGRREAELAMPRLFGGFGFAFFAAYEEAWPLAPGSERRLAVYELYHLLNHLLLFGQSYRARCLATMRQVL